MMKQFHSVLATLTFVAMAVALVACPPVENKTDATVAKKGDIYVKGLFDMSGGTADVGVAYKNGVVDSIDETAEEEYYIRGYQVHIDWVDYAYNPQTAQAQYDEWKAADDWDKIVTLFGWGTADTLALSQTVATDKMPYVSASYAGSIASPVPVNESIPMPDGSTHTVTNPGSPYNFFAGTDYSTSIRIALKYLKFEESATNVTFAYCSAGYCTDPIPAGKSYADEIDLTVDDDLRYELANTEAEIDTIVADYFASGAHSHVQWVWSGNTTKTTVYLTKALATHAPNVKVIGNVWSLDENVDALCGAACRGRMFVVTSFAMYGDMQRGDGMADVLRLHDKMREQKGEAVTEHATARYVQGYTSFVMWKRAVENLIDRGDDITTENIKAAFERFNNVPLGGLVPAVTCTPEDHRPTNKGRIYGLRSDGRLGFEQEITVVLSDDWLGW